MQARVGQAPAQDYAEIQKAPPHLSPQAPLVFDLDDLVLRDAGGALPLGEGHRVTIFDRHLAIRDRDAAAPHLSTLSTPPTRLLPGPQATYVEGEGIERTTFVIHHMADFYLVGEDRHTGAPGVTYCVGARVAAAGGHPAIIDPRIGRLPTRCELHFFADALPADRYVEGGGSAEVCHLMVHVPVKVEKGTDATDEHAST